MTAQPPPRAAVGLVELFAPSDSAEIVLGDLEEEFVSRLPWSGHRAARRWFWYQAFRTIVHLLSGAVRAAPWSTAAQVLASFVVASLLHGVMIVWIGRLVGNLPIYDYDTSVWSWRVAGLLRFVAIPLALGWSIAALARGREMVITTLVAAVLVALLLVSSLTINARILWLGPGQRFGLYWTFMHVFELFVVQTIFPLGIFIGGTFRRFQRMRVSARSPRDPGGAPGRQRS